ncbi:hypothetical protein L9F63_027733, partial [Diploptera punctata]
DFNLLATNYQSQCAHNIFKYIPYFSNIAVIQQFSLSVTLIVFIYGEIIYKHVGVTLLKINLESLL